MAESANFHHHQHQHQLQLQEQFADQYHPTSAATQLVYKASTSNPSIILNGNTYMYNTYLTESIPGSREIWPKNAMNDPLLRTNSMTQGFSFCDAKSTQQSANELLLEKIKEEMPNNFPKLSEMLSNAEESHSVLSTKHDHQHQCSPAGLYDNDLWLGNISFRRQITGQQQPLVGDLYSNNTQNNASFGGVAGSSRYKFSHVFPSTNSSPSDLSSSLVSSSLGLNLQTLDLLTSTNYGANFSQTSHDMFGLRKEGMSLSPDHHHMQQLADSPSNSSNKVTSANFMKGITTTKRPSSFSEPKQSLAEAKKSRSVSRCSCPPLKVRKEKLGDRIAALQKLVAPFGKTDTASVLTEAIGYIQFLHHQVQTLSVPYMKSLHSKPSRATQQGLSCEEDGTEPKRDLTSRGLCLLPLSYASYINAYE